MPVTMVYSDHFDDPEELERDMNRVLDGLPVDARVHISLAGGTYGVTNILFVACIYWQVPAGSADVQQAMAQVTE